MKIFEHEAFGKIRTLMTKDEPWFVDKERTLSFAKEVPAFRRDSKDYQKHLDKQIFWERSHSYMDMAVNDMKKAYSLGYKDIRKSLEETMNSNHKDFVKNLVGIEKGIDNEETLNSLYE